MKEMGTYLNFNGNAREAMNFYKDCFQGELQIMTYADVKGKVPPEYNDKVMHSKLMKGPLALMAADMLPGVPFTPGDNYSITITCESLQEIETLFAALSRGGAGDDAARGDILERTLRNADR